MTAWRVAFRGAWRRGAANALLPPTADQDTTHHWTLRENVRANLRRLVRRVLRRHGYPPDQQEAATRTVLEQAGALSASWAVRDQAGSE